MVVSQAEPLGDRLLVVAELLPHALAHRLQGLKARAVAGGVQPHALAGAMVHRQEDGGHTLGRPAAGGISAPHLVGAVGRDVALMAGWLWQDAGAVGCE